MRLNDWRSEAEEYREIDKAIVEKLVPWCVNLNKHRATWTHTTHNPHGGSFGSNYCGPQYIALARATRNIPIGASYTLMVNGKDRGTHIKTEGR